MPRTFRSPAEEIWLSVQEWYFSRGLKVPADEAKIFKDDIVKEKQELDYVNAFLTKKHKEDELAQIKYEQPDDLYARSAVCIQEIAVATKQITATPKELRFLEGPVATGSPAYGSPEFWKEHWAKKKAAGWTPKAKAKAST
jgi:hypothetical protein